LDGGKGTWPVKTEWWAAGVVVCLGQGADLHVAQLIPLALTIACICPSRLPIADISRPHQKIGYISHICREAPVGGFAPNLVLR